MDAFRRIVSNPQKLQKLQKLAMDDYALCGSGMYLNADCESLRLMTHLTIWLFFFDDKVDSIDGEPFDDQLGFQSLAREALDYVAYTLG